MRLLGALLVATLVSCGATSSPSGGVRGAVTAGPMCPVERAESPCPPAPWTGTVRATAATGATYDTMTDASGGFELHLPDGSYTIAPVIEGGGPPTAEPVAVTVTGGAVQTVDLTVDTGIR